MIARWYPPLQCGWINNTMFESKKEFMRQIIDANKHGLEINEITDALDLRRVWENDGQPCTIRFSEMIAFEIL